MYGNYLVRVGAFGSVGRFAASDGLHYPRGTPVIVRTDRGLECGEVLCAAAPDDPAWGPAGELLRGMTIEDHLLAARLRKNRDEAFEACRRRLIDASSDLVLMDVEYLFDGSTLVFYFLGDATPADERLLSELAEAYDAQALVRSFAETLTVGCGPDCGTKENGCGDSCSSCAVASACSTRRS